MKIDSHQHFWIYNCTEYSWIDNSMSVLKRDYLPSDLLPELEEAGFSGSVAVQARQSVKETRWLLQMAEQYDFIKGVVGWVDLCSEDNLKRQLDEFSRSDKLVGIRHVVHDEPDDMFMLRDDFLRGIGRLKEYNLTYDLLLFPRHLQVAEKVVSMFPDQKFVLDHMAKPLIKNRILSPWEEDIKQLSKHKNVWCKLSGMVTEADVKNWKPEDFHPYLDIVFKAFGPDRLMTGSDWPVCLVGGGYSEIADIAEKFMSGMPAERIQRISGGNCAEFYSLSS